MADSSLAISTNTLRNGLVILVLLGSLLSVSLANSQCSCYTFYGNTTSRDWDVSKKECKSNGGDLVSMETIEEWEFIRTQLQIRSTSSGQDRWWIGLTRENGVWQWISGRNLTYNKWKPGLQLYSNGQDRAIIEKNEGVLWNKYWYLTMGSICEQKNTECDANQVKRCFNVTSTTSLPPQTTLPGSTIAIAKVTSITSKVVRDVPQSTESSTTIIGQTTTMASSMSSTTSSDKGDTGIIRKKANSSLSMKIVIVIIVAIIVLLLLFGIIIICICSRKHRNKTRKKNNEEQEQFILQPQSGSYESNDKPNNESNIEQKSTQEPPPYIYATVDKTAKTKHKTPEPIYENVKKPTYVNVDIPIYENFQQLDPSKPQELHYVSVSECTSNDIPPEVPRPMDYEPTEYATLDIDDANNS